MKKISVIVPVYNVEKYLEKCLTSLVNQTLKDIEIIIVNDESPDNSSLIIEKFEKNYSNIKSIYQKNGGLSSARNTGLNNATGEYVSFIDSDDWIELNMLEDMFNYAKSENLDIVCSNTLLVYDNGKSKEIKGNFNLSNNYKDFLLSPPMACNKIYKRNLFNEDTKFKTGIFYEDLELIPSLIIKTKKIGYIDKPYYNYYQRSGSIVHQKKFNNKILDIFNVLESIKQKFINSNLFDEYSQEIEYLYIEHLLYSSALRISSYKQECKKYIPIILETIKKDFPNWKKNQYYNKKSWKFKLICKLTNMHQYKLINLLNSINS